MWWTLNTLGYAGAKQLPRIHFAEVLYEAMSKITPIFAAVYSGTEVYPLNKKKVKSIENLNLKMSRKMKIKFALHANIQQET